MLVPAAKGANQLQHCPIVFITHSLGGIILKRVSTPSWHQPVSRVTLLINQAASLIHGLPQRLESLRQRISGAILLSSPHSTSSSTWSCIPLILKTYLGSKTKHTIDPEMTSGLADDCLNFEKVFDNVRVLSLYETEETRTGGIFGPKTVVCRITERNAKTKSILTKICSSYTKALLR